jgi:hypothetical protein
MVGVIRQVVVDWLVADRALAPRRLSGNKHCCYRVGHDPMLAEERDHRRQGKAAIRCALGEPADRTWVPVCGHPPTPFGRDLT